MLRSVAVICLAAAASAKVAKPSEAAAKAKFAQINKAALFRAMHMKAEPAIGTGTDACASYTNMERCRDDANATLNCVWAFAHGDSSYLKGEEDMVCRTIRCHDILDMDMSGGGDIPQECGNFLGQGSCQWDDEAYVCWERGQTIDCEHRALYDESSCTAAGCNFSQFECHTPGRVQECGLVDAYDESSCTSGHSDCAWDAGTPNAVGFFDCAVCYNRTRFLGGFAPCAAFLTNSHACCPDRCKWTVIQAPKRPAYDDDVVTDVPGKTDNYHGICTDPSEEIACEFYLDGEDCRERSACEWEEESTVYGTCHPIDRPVACVSLNDQACTTADRCLWVKGPTDGPDSGMDDINDGYCQNCPANKNCSQTYVGPGADHGQPCASHTDMDCPTEDGRCAIRHPGDDVDDLDDLYNIQYNGWECSSKFAPGGGTAAGTCEDATCDNEFERGPCTAKAGCSWSPGAYSCYNSTAGPPCHRFFGRDSCPPSSCKWLASMPGCASDDGGSCVALNATHAPCKGTLRGAACCPHQCSFDVPSQTCREANYQESCESYGEFGCPPGRTDCITTLGICHASSTPLACGDICDSYLCSASGSCAWDERQDDGRRCSHVATTPPPVVCGSLNRDDCYGHKECKVVGGRCTAAVCADIDDQEFCGARSRPCAPSDAPGTCNCAWHDFTGCFYADEDLPCSKHYSLFDCPSDRCTFDRHCLQCLDGPSSSSTREECPCHSYWMGDECPSRCVFDNSDNYEHCSVATTGINPPALNGGGDHNMTSCSQTLKTKLAPVLDAAADDCSIANNDGDPATQGQLKCLNYYLSMSKISITEACPCLYYWAIHEQPVAAAWMQVNC